MFGWVEVRVWGLDLKSFRALWFSVFGFAVEGGPVRAWVEWPAYVWMGLCMGILIPVMDLISE